MDSDYTIAQEELREAFVELAKAKQNLLNVGGEVTFKVHRNELYLEIDQGGTLSFPFIKPKSGIV